MQRDIRQTRAEMSETLHEIEDHFSPSHLKERIKDPSISGDRETVRIQQDIRHTRSEMNETIDELGHRLSPHYLKEQVKDSVRSTAHDAGTSMLDTIKENPIPSLIAGLSIGWLIAKAGQSDHRERDSYGRYDGPGYYVSEYEGSGYRRRSAARESYPYREPYPYRERYEGEAASMADRAGDMAYEAGERASDVAHEARERVGDVAHEAREMAGDVADSARDLAYEAGHRVQDAAYEAGHRVQDAAYEAQRYGRRATNWLGRTMEQNPLAAGAVAIAAGALVGLAVPETRTEHRLMGEASDRVREQAPQFAKEQAKPFAEKAEQAKNVVKETAEEAKEKTKETAEVALDNAQDVAQTAKEESRKQGLTGSRS